MKIKILAAVLLTAFSLQFAKATAVIINTAAINIQVPPPPPGPPRIHVNSPFRHHRHRYHRAHRVHIHLPPHPPGPPGPPGPPPRP